jgi:uncharacterized membrane protein
VLTLKTWFAASLLSALSWVVCETLGGLAFLSSGVRLWSYHLAPLFWNITSPVVWLVVFLVMGPLILTFQRFELRRQWKGARRIAYRLLFLVVVGPVAEVLTNELVFKVLLGKALYTYLVLPTFGGSGSLLSPFYYATLYIHYPMNRVLQARSPSPQTA